MGTQRKMVKLIQAACCPSAKAHFALKQRNIRSFLFPFHSMFCDRCQGRPLAIALVESGEQTCETRCIAPLNELNAGNHDLVPSYVCWFQAALFFLQLHLWNFCRQFSNFFLGSLEPRNCTMAPRHERHGTSVTYLGAIKQTLQRAQQK